MKYCQNCGTQVNDDALFCPNCGASLGNDAANVNQNTTVNTQPAPENIMTTLAKVFLIIATIINGFAIIPLAWCIPMCISYFNKIKNGLYVSADFKVCVLLFVGILPGIFMLCDSEH